MIMQRFSAPVLLATAVLVSGCNKKDKAPAPEPAAAAGSGAPATPPPAAPAAGAPAAGAPAAGAPAAAAGDNGVVPVATLAAITLPAPKGAPASGMWLQASAGGDGDRLVNFVDGNDYWYTVRFIDCRAPMVKEFASKPAGERGDIAYCFDTPTGKLKDYPLFTPKDPADTLRVIKVGHLTMLASIGAAGEGKLKGSDVEAFLESVDLASIAKL